MVAVHPTQEQDALDLLDMHYERHRAQLGFQELFESGDWGDLAQP